MAAWRSPTAEDESSRRTVRSPCRVTSALVRRTTRSPARSRSASAAASRFGPGEGGDRRPGELDHDCPRASTRRLRAGRWARPVGRSGRVGGGADRATSSPKRASRSLRVCRGCHPAISRSRAAAPRRPRARASRPSRSVRSNSSSRSGVSIAGVNSRRDATLARSSKVRATVGNGMPSRSVMPEDGTSGAMHLEHARKSARPCGTEPRCGRREGVAPEIRPGTMAEHGGRAAASTLPCRFRARSATGGQPLRLRDARGADTPMPPAGDRLSVETRSPERTVRHDSGPPGRQPPDHRLPSGRAASSGERDVWRRPRQGCGKGVTQGGVVWRYLNSLRRWGGRSRRPRRRPLRSRSGRGRGPPRLLRGRPCRARGPRPRRPGPRRRRSWRRAPPPWSVLPRRSRAGRGPHSRSRRRPARGATRDRSCRRRRPPAALVSRLGCAG